MGEEKGIEGLFSARISKWSLCSICQSSSVSYSALEIRTDDEIVNVLSFSGLLSMKFGLSVWSWRFSKIREISPL